MASPLDGNKVEIPLLKSYLRTTPSYPPHVPSWILPIGWALFAALGIVLAVVTELNCVGVILSGIVSYLFVVLARGRFKPRSAAEKADEARFEAVRKLKGLVDEGLNRKLPPAILRALEQAVAVRNTVVARLNSENPGMAMEETMLIEQSLQACFLVAVPVIRQENTSKNEWQAILDNASMINEIEDTITSQTRRMRDMLGLNSERLAALRELEEYNTGEHLRLTE